MYIYLPIAEISMHIGIIIGLGGGVGFLSGLFGVGGGFLMTPLLIFFGIPPAVAVASIGPHARRRGPGIAHFRPRRKAVHAVAAPPEAAGA